MGVLGCVLVVGEVEVMIFYGFRDFLVGGFLGWAEFYELCRLLLVVLFG